MDFLPEQRPGTAQNPPSGFPSGFCSGNAIKNTQATCFLWDSGGERDRKCRNMPFDTVSQFELETSEPWRRRRPAGRKVSISGGGGGSGVSDSLILTSQEVRKLSIAGGGGGLLPALKYYTLIL